MKIIIKSLIILSIFFSINISDTHAATDYVNKLSSNEKNLDVSDKQEGGKQGNTNTHLESIKDDSHLNAGNTGETGIVNALLRIAKDLKNIFFIIATVYFLVIILRLLLTENSEEEFGKFKKGILWITVGIIVMQISFSFVTLSFDKGVDGGVANDILKGVVEPLVGLLETAASFFFIAIAIFAFYKLVSSSGDEEKAKSGKMSVAYAIIGFIVIRVAKWVVDATYSQTLCEVDGVSCTDPKTLEDGAGVIFTIINWMNGFVGIAVVIMIIYVGSQIIFSSGDEEKIKKAKSGMIYIFIGIILLVLNYFILTFFLLDKIEASTGIFVPFI